MIAIDAREKEKTHRPSSLKNFHPPSLPLSPPGYFSQFGAITRLRVSRNKKTAKARSYAFIEFASPDVAAIAAEAMDG